ncbi:hypothetical protein DM860_000224 [Cuscuta australis]|uniref:Uncharacterized protein n=1 Tax=Cuscuta australis TaxID=267555 RepID=A0A328CXY1_9ASTE|nr:hypothetical protein DM860_000224 [Cuscuta australis]
MATLRATWRGLALVVCLVLFLVVVPSFAARPGRTPPTLVVLRPKAAAVAAGKRVLPRSLWLNLLGKGGSPGSGPTKPHHGESPVKAPVKA